MTKYSKNSSLPIWTLFRKSLDEAAPYSCLVKFRKEKIEMHLASLATLAKDWLKFEEDQAWLFL
jgi:hypothetical protein